MSISDGDLDLCREYLSPLFSSNRNPRQIEFYLDHVHSSFLELFVALYECSPSEAAANNE